MNILTDTNGGLVLTKDEMEGVAEILRPIFLKNIHLKEQLLKAAMDELEGVDEFTIQSNNRKYWDVLLVLTGVTAEDFE